jgi:hypothetical protein
MTRPAFPSVLPDAGAGAPRTLEDVIAELRRVAIWALDAGHPIAAARIATTADLLAAEAWPPRPPRPAYQGDRTD